MTMIKLLLVELLLLLFPISALRVYLLAGDTNMEGYANITHLANLMTVSGSRFSRYGSNQGFNVRNDVFIRTQRNEIGALSIGYGARSNTFGPELGFGFEVGDYFEDDVLIIKAAWDNSSLNQDFRPPSSSGGTGPRYEDMINMYRSTIEDLATFAPLYGGGGYSLEGFVWFHGYQDSLSEGAINEYEGLLINLLRDLIRDLGEPNLPIIIGELGMQGSNPSTSHVRMRAIQRLVAERREFNAIFVSTSPFVNTSETFDAVYTTRSLSNRNY
jgi:alpha-galactosidase